MTYNFDPTGYVLIKTNLFNSLIIYKLCRSDTLKYFTYRKDSRKYKLPKETEQFLGSCEYLFVYLFVYLFKEGKKTELGAKFIHNHH